MLAWVVKAAHGIRMIKPIITLSMIVTIVIVTVMGTARLIEGQGEIYRPGQVITIGASLPGICTIGSIFILNAGPARGTYFCDTVNTWTSIPPQGSLMFFTSNIQCPAGYSEATDLDGKILLATTIAHANVGTTRGNTNITPPGTGYIRTIVCRKN